MPAFGGFSPFPLRFGGGRPTVQVLFESLAADRGTAVDAADTTKGVGIETMATARAIAGTWATNERLGNMWDPWKCDAATLYRWEKILNILPSPEDTERNRRKRVANIFKRFGRSVTKAYLTELLLRDVPEAFVSVDSIGYTYAASRDEVHVPDGSYPFGTVSDQPWSSSVSRVLVRLTFPANWTISMFLEAVGQVYATLDPVLPAWAEIDWYSSDGPTYVDLSGASGLDGPTGAGIYLDREHTLDASIFDV